MDNNQLLMNQIIEKLIKADDNNEQLTLTAEEVKELRVELGDQFYMPVLSMEEIVKLCEEGKIGQSPFNRS